MMINATTLTPAGLRREEGTGGLSNAFIYLFSVTQQHCGIKGVEQSSSAFTACVRVLKAS